LSLSGDRFSLLERLSRVSIQIAKTDATMTAYAPVLDFPLIHQLC
jgi:hypothetical protein